MGEARVDPLCFTETHIDPVRISKFSSCNLPILKCKINDVECNCLIDSGASMNLLAWDTFQLLKGGLMLDTPPIELKSLAGTALVTSNVVQCNIVFQDKSYVTQFVVSNTNLSPQFEVIIGLNFLNAFGFVLDTSKSVLYNNDVFLTYPFARTYPHNVQLKNDNDVCVVNQDKNLPDENFKNGEFHEKTLMGSVFTKTLIPPGTQRYVDIRINNVENYFNIGDIVLLEQNHKLKNDSVMVARTISNLKENNLCLALILNVDTKPITLNKGMLITNAFKIHQIAKMESINTLTDSGGRCKNIDWEKLVNFEHLENHQKLQVINLLNKYESVFAQDITELGQCGIVQHEIHLTDPIPTRQKPYRVPYHLKSEMRNQINTLLEAGIIQPSKSAFAAPVLLVKKSDNSYRLVADLRKLNSKTVPDNFPLPNLSEMIDNLAGAKYFTTMDLTSGFHQMLLHPNSTHLTGITTEFGLFEYKRLPFGLRNASSSFQRLMSIVLDGLNDLQIAFYIDDICVASKSFNEHLQRLEMVLQRLLAANLKVKPSKCSFLQFEISFLGHTVREGQVLPDTKNLKAIKDSLPPNTKKKVRSFLGLTGFYRKFIPNYSKIALPLTNLTKDKTNFVWSEREQEAFEILKNYLISEPCLHLPDFSRPFCLFTDASKHSIGCFLAQEDPITNFPHPIAFASRKLKDAELNYATAEKETLALVYAITHFRNYIYGSHFKVYSDQQFLSKVKNFKDPTSRIARWFLTLQQYDYTIVYKPGRLNYMADYLSRALYPVDKNSNHNRISQEVNNVNAQFDLQDFSIIPINELIDHQKKDPFCIKIKSKLESNFIFSKNSPKYFFENGLLLCKNFNLSGRNKLSTKLVVPQSLVNKVLELSHDSEAVAHPGLSRTLKRVQKNYFWKGQFRQVKNYIASCHKCIRRRGYAKHIEAPIQRVPTADYPFQKCSFDAVGPLVTSTHGNKWIIVITDYFTRYAEAYPVQNIQSHTVANVLIDFISRHGIMQVLYSDRGTNFISEAMKEIYTKFGINKITTLSYSPRSNGVVERLNKTLIDSLSHLVSETQENWCEHVPLALMAYRNAYHRSIGESPVFLVTGRTPVMPYDLIFSEKERYYSDTPSYARQLISKLQTSFAIVKENLEKAADEIQRVNDSRKGCKKISVGDLVYLHTPQIKVHTSKKLAKKNHGPYRVLKQFSPVNFQIQHIHKHGDTQNVHLNRLIKVEKRDTYPSLRDEEDPYANGINQNVDKNWIDKNADTSQNTLNVTSDNVLNEDNYTPLSEEEMIKLYPCLALPMTEWVDDQQCISFQPRSNSESTQINQSVNQVESSASYNVESIPSTTELSFDTIDDYTGNAHISVLQSCCDITGSAHKTVCDDFPGAQTQFLTQANQITGAKTYNLRPRNAFGFVKYK